MFSNIFLLHYEKETDVDEKLYDNNCTTMLSASIDYDVFQSIEKMLIDKEIYEIAGSNEIIKVKIIPTESLEICQQEIVSLYLKELDNIKTNLVNPDLFDRISSLTKKGNVLELLRIKIEKYLNDDNIIVMLGN